MSLLWPQIALLAGLTGYLLWKHWLRWQAQRRTDAARLTGHGFEATELKARFGNLRERHQRIASLHRRQTVAHEAFVISLRKSLLRRSFFRAAQEPDSPSSDHNHDLRSRAA